MVVFDEAHELEDVATDYFGVTVSNLRVDELLRDVENTLRRADVPITDVMPACGQRARALAVFLFAASAGRGPLRLREPRRSFWKKMATSISACRMRCCISTPSCRRIPNKPDEVHALAAAGGRVARATGIHSGSRASATSSSGSSAAAIGAERPQRRSTTCFCRPRRLRCRDILRKTLFEHLESAVLTSATLAVAGGFDYIRNRLGDRARARTGGAVALRLREPGAAVRSARPARSARAAASSNARRNASGSCWRSRAAARSACSPATR